ncbi:MAG: Omp28-related outer membrane protein [Flavobacteriales bacterium]|nr:Omp28-related outer membrane protein [Flavobacteriales bacterium]
MKHLSALVLLAPLTAIGQSLVSTQPQNRTALLEDFTGIHCQYCPEGHTVAAAIETAHPDDVVIVGVHAGPYATPGTGEPDFQTTAGAEIDAHFTISGYPGGVINRHIFNGLDDLGRGAWEGAVNEILVMTSPANLGMQSSFDNVSRLLTVNVDVYYTDNSPAGSDYISVLLKESDIIGPQTSTGGNIPAYQHNHVLRAYLTPGTWGDEVTTTTAGTLVQRTYTYTVPVDFNIANCEVVAFVSEDKTEVYQAREVLAEGGTTLIVGNLTGPATPYAAGSSGSTTAFTNTFSNELGASADYIFTLASADAPADWTSSFDIQGSNYTGSTTLAVNTGVQETISVNVTPGATVGVATYELTVAAASEPNAPILSQLYYIISGVTDLVVSNPLAEVHEPIYMSGLTVANQPGRAKAKRDLFSGFAAANALGAVNNLYFNVSWTFPSLTDAVVGQLIAFLDAGGNLMIAGQDIGWDQSGDAAAYGTAITQAFYTDYMYADYVADGSTTNSSVNFEDADAVFGSVPNSNINAVFGANSYPEEITPIAPAVPIFRYNTPTKIGGLRVETANYKLVYFGVGPEQMTDVAVADKMIQLSHDWFYGIVSVQELDEAFQGSMWPVPASDLLNVSLEAKAQGYDVLDAAGRTVLAERFAAPSDRLVIAVNELRTGLYTLQVTAENGARTARTFSVVR